MSISFQLSTLADLTLIACDDSYFTNTSKTRPAQGPTTPTDLYIDDPLAPLNDTVPNQDNPLDPTAQNYQPPYPYASLTQGYSVFNEVVNQNTGFKCVLFQNPSPSQPLPNQPLPNYVIAFGGTDGSDTQDWKGNLFSWGYTSWKNDRNAVFAMLDGLPRDANHQLMGTISFTGQSLGGALAQYAVYEWLSGQDPNRGVYFDGNGVEHQISAFDDASHLTLTTFNGLGGVYALQKNDGLGTVQGPTPMDALQSAANFVVGGDLVSRLGGGDVAGSIYQLNFPPDSLNQNTGLPYSATLGPIASHRIEPGFYANLPTTGFFGVPDSEITVNPQNYVLVTDQLTNATALLGNLLNAKGPFVGSNLADLLAGLATALAFSNPVQLNGFTKAVWNSFYDTGNITKATYTTLNALNFPIDLALKAVAVAAAPVTVIAAGLSDLFSLGLKGVQTAFSDVTKFLNLDPPAPASEAPDEYAMKMMIYLSDVPGSFATPPPLAQEFTALSINSDTFSSDELAQQLLTANSMTWRTVLESQFRDKLGTDQLFKTVELADAFDQTMKLVPQLDSATLATLDQERDGVILETSEGIANKFAGVTLYPNVAYTPSVTFTFADMQQIVAGYQTELANTTISAAARVDAQQAMAILERAAELPVIVAGISANPFDVPGFNPSTFSPSSVNIQRGQGQTMTLSLPFAAGQAGQQIALQLQGNEAGKFQILTDSGELTPDANGVVDVTIPEGEQQFTFNLFATTDAKTNSSLMLSATPLDQNGQPAGPSRLEATIQLTAPTQTNQFPTLFYPLVNGQTLVPGYGFFTQVDIPGQYPQGVIWGSGDVNYHIMAAPTDWDIETQAGNDSIVGSNAPSFIGGGGGNDTIYGGNGGNVMLGDWRDDGIGVNLNPNFPNPGAVPDGQDYLVGGAGNDIMGGGGGNDVLSGGAGNDQLSGDASVEGLLYTNAQGNPQILRVGNYVGVEAAQGTYAFLGVLHPGNDFLDGGTGNDTLIGDGGNDTLFGGTGDDFLNGDTPPDLNAQLLYPQVPGNDFLDGGAGNDFLFGDGGNDTLLGGDGNDVLNGDTGNDVLQGGAGSDTYRFQIGDGQDTIIDSAAPGDSNTIMFETGIRLTDLTVTQDTIAHTLVIGYGGAGDTITLKNFDPNGVFGTSVIQNIVVADWKNDPNPTGIGFTLASFLPPLSGFVDGTNAGNAFANNTITTGPTDDFIEGGPDGMTLDAGAGNDTISGGRGNDTIYGGTGDNQLYGGAGNDLIYSEGANDTIDGGFGNDTFIGTGGGTYTYLFGIGSGHDAIDGSQGGNYVVQLSGNLAPSDVTVARSGQTITLNLPGGQDGLSLHSFATNQSLLVQFPDGTVWNQNTLPLPGGVVTGTSGNDTIQTGATNDSITAGAGSDVIDAGPGNDTVDGGDGNDVIHGGTGTNQLFGGPGNDLIYSEGINDTIDGGLGNDRLIGTGGGSSTYLFGVGGGKDVIDASQGGNYLVQLSGNLAPSNVTVERSGQDLILTLPGGQDTLTLGSFYSNPSYQVEFQDGTVWDKNGLHMQAGSTIQGTAGNDFLYSNFEGFSYVIEGLGGDDYMQGGAGNDTLSGGDGNDTINGARGNNQLFGGAGDDSIFGQGMNDTIDGGAGNDTLAGIGGGNFTYLFGVGGGQDVINVIQGGNYLVQLSGSLAPSDVTVVRSSQDLILTLPGGQDSLTLQSFYTNPSVQVEFSNGTVWDKNALHAQAGTTQIGTDGNDSLIGYPGFPNTLVGGAGDDIYFVNNPTDTIVEAPGGGNDSIYSTINFTLPANFENLTLLERTTGPDGYSAVPLNPVPTLAIGNDLNNVITGNSYDDRLEGGAGDDTLVAGLGIAGTFSTAVDQTLVGGAGNDTYVYNAGYGGIDTIIDDTSTGDTNTIITNATASTMHLAFQGSTLELIFTLGFDSVIENTQELLIPGFDPTDAYRATAINQISLDEGATYLTYQQLIAMGISIQSSGPNQLVTGTNADDRITGNPGDTLSGGVGNDTYLYNRGNGAEVIQDVAVPGAMNAITFVAGINPGDLSFVQGATTLTINTGARGESLTLDQFDPSDVAGSLVADTITFTDGLQVSLATLLAPGITADNTEIQGTSGPDLLDVTGVNDTVLAGAGDDTVLGGSGPVTLNGGDGNDFLAAGSGSVSLVGDAGDDTLYGGSGTDTLVGGPGDDVLNGGSGDTTYVFNRGDGHDIIHAQGSASTNHLVFGPGISLPDLSYGPYSSSIGIGINGDFSNGDLIELPNVVGQTPVVSTATFADGTTVDLYQYYAASQIQADQVLVSTTPNETLIGGAGNDMLIGGPGNSMLIGGAGQNTLIGGSGHTTFVSNSVPNVLSNDLFISGSDGNTYIINSGSGVNRIRLPNTNLPGTNNHVQFASGYDSLNPSLGVGSLDIHYGTSGGELIIEGFDPNNAANNPGIDAFQFADRTLTYDQLIALGFDLSATGADQVVNGTSVTDRLTGVQGNDTLIGRGGDDTFSGAPGDVFIGGSGNDTFNFNLGDGQEIIQDTALPGEGNRIQFGVGIAQADLTFTQDQVARTLTIQVGNSGADHLLLTNFDPTGSNGSLAVAALTFTDGGSINLADLFPTATNHAPTVANLLADQTVQEDTPFSVVVPANTFIDEDAGDVLSYSATLANGNALPTWLSLDANTHTFSGMADDAQVGSLALQVTATDSGNLTASDVFTLTVTNVNEAPTIASALADQQATEGVPFSLVVPTGTFADVDPGDSLIYSATLANGSALPAWLGFNGTTRTFTGTPGSGNAGLVNIKVTATDTGNLSAFDLFDLTVINQDQVLSGTVGGDVLTGGVGNDQLFGLGGNDTLIGGAGNDLLDGGTGTDTMQGGLGDDTYIVDNLGDVVTENVNEGTDTVQSSTTYTLGSNVENLTLTGTAAINGTGNGLDNVLRGNSGNNILTGGTGNDFLDGGLGNDTMIGGIGNDTYVVNQAGDVVNESLNQGTDTVQSSITYTLGSNVENLTLTGMGNINGTGSSANNVLVGNNGNNTLDGGSGNDTLDGGDGNDSLLGGSGNDALTGGIGNDSIDGGSGADSLTGGTGADMLLGGSDNDMLDGGEGDDILDAGSGDDVLTGGAGTDQLLGGSGNDRLTGGIGNDSLLGGTGNDTYLIARGEGQDTISENDSTAGNSDTLLYGATINPLDLVLSRQANDLRLAVHGSTDSVTIQNWYSAPTTAQVETIQAGNGQTLLSTQVNQLIQAMAGFTQQTGLTWDQAIGQRPQAVQTVLAASWH